MSFRSIFIILLTFGLAIFAFAFFFSDKTYDMQISQKNNQNKTIIQFTPLPTMVSNHEGVKDNSLYNLLINKVSSVIKIKNADFQFDTLINHLPLKLENLNIEFSYSESENRVNFNGNGVLNKDTKVHGYYEITNKNNVKYNINITKLSQSLQMELIYNPNETDNLNDGIIDGQFVFIDNTEDLFFGSADGGSITISSSFTIDNKSSMSMQNLNVKSDNISAKLKLDIVDSSPKAKVDLFIQELNIENKFELNKLLLGAIMSKVIDFDADINLVGENNIKYKDKDLHNLKVKASSENKKMHLEGLSFSTANETNISIIGDITRNNFRPSFKGKISAKNIHMKDIDDRYTSEKSAGATTHSSASMDSDIWMSVSALLMENLVIRDNESSLSSDNIKFYMHNKEMVVESKKIMINDYNKDASLISWVLGDHKPNVKFTSVGALVGYLQSSNSINANIEFNNLTNNAEEINNISFQYTKHHGDLSIKDITSTDAEFNITGDINVILNGSVPHLNVNLSGSNLNMVAIKKLLFDDTLDNNSKSGIFDVNLLGVNGDINIDINGKGDNLLSAINCKSTMNEGNINLKNCELGMLGGKLNILEGHLTLGNELMYSAKYESSNMQLKNTIDFVGAYLYNSMKSSQNTKKLSGSGTFNISGYEESHGINAGEIISNAKGDFNIKSVGDASIENFDIYSVVNTYGNPGGSASGSAPTIAVVGKKQAQGDSLNKKKLNTEKSKTTKNTKITMPSIVTKFYGNFTANNGIITTEDFHFSTKDNIQGIVNMSYNMIDKKLDSVISLAYLKKNNKKADGFNLSVSGDINNLKTKLGVN